MLSGDPPKTCPEGKLNHLTTTQGEAQMMTSENPVYYSGHAPQRTPGRGRRGLPSVHKRNPESPSPRRDTVSCRAGDGLVPHSRPPGATLRGHRGHPVLSLGPMPSVWAGSEREGSWVVEKRPLCGGRTHPLLEKTPLHLASLVLIAAFGERPCSGKGAIVSRLWAPGRTPGPRGSG